MALGWEESRGKMRNKARRVGKANPIAFHPTRHFTILGSRLHSSQESQPRNKGFSAQPCQPDFCTQGRAAGRPRPKPEAVHKVTRYTPRADTTRGLTGSRATWSWQAGNLEFHCVPELHVFPLNNSAGGSKPKPKNKAVRCARNGSV